MKITKTRKIKEQEKKLHMVEGIKLVDEFCFLIKTMIKRVKCYSSSIIKMLIVTNMKNQDVTSKMLRKDSY